MSENLTAGERNKLEKRLVQRMNVLRQSISGDQIDEHRIKEKMLAEQGITLASKEYTARYEDLKRQREELIEPLIQQEKNSLRVRRSELEGQKKEELDVIQNEYKNMLTELKLKLQRAIDELNLRYTASFKELETGLEKIRLGIMEKDGKQISEQIEEAKKMEIKVSSVERQIESLCKTRVAFLKRQAGRIGQILDDAQNKLLEELMFIGTREQAKGLLERIPEAAQIFQMLDSPEGIDTLIQKINPSAAQAVQRMLLTSEINVVQIDTPVKTVTAEDPYTNIVVPTEVVGEIVEEVTP